MTLSRLFSAVGVGIFIVLMVCVRIFEVELFHDPLYYYFHSNFQLYDLPNLSNWKIVAGTSLRYLFNMVLSLWIIWFLYKKKSFIDAALWVYLFAYVVLMITFLFLLEANSDFMKMALFYVRRFLTQPILLLVLVAGFYFLKAKESKLA